MLKVKNIIRVSINNLILLFANLTRTNLTEIGYSQKGIGYVRRSFFSYRLKKERGEYFFIKNILRKAISKEKPIFFDVGSNKNDYSNMLLEFFDEPIIYAFEANPNIFSEIKKDTKIDNYNLALGSEEKDVYIYDYENKNITNSSKSTLHKKVLTDFFEKDKVKKILTKMITIDSFCKKNNINHIDFIKIDTEGNEFDILKGSKEMLDQDKINIIQFEFNKMNIISRVFLKDFYDLLKNYDFYRIKEKKLIPLGEYKEENEIFKYQNIVAINKNVKK